MINLILQLTLCCMMFGVAGLSQYLLHYNTEYAITGLSGYSPSYGLSLDDCARACDRHASCYAFVHYAAGYG